MNFPGNALLHSAIIMFGLTALGQSGHASEISGLYFGGDVGVARIDYDNAHYQKQLENSIAGSGKLDFTNAYLRKDNTAWWLYSGYMFSQNVGVEAAYLHFGALYDHLTGK